MLVPKNFSFHSRSARRAARHSTSDFQVAKAWMRSLSVTAFLQHFTALCRGLFSKAFRRRFACSAAFFCSASSLAAFFSCTALRAASSVALRVAWHEALWIGNASTSLASIFGVHWPSRMVSLGRLVLWLYSTPIRMAPATNCPTKRSPSSYINSPSPSATPSALSGPVYVPSSPSGSSILTLPSLPPPCTDGWTADLRGSS
mmetsp:Transcript_16466/g.47003  ORF Transcript_16466/g.47003 Transcript_16466/m.47003 type:complete len:202 (-) Transcript_16466:77-682(-)